MAGIHVGIGRLIIIHLAGREASLAAPATAGPATRLHLDPLGLGEFQQRIGTRIQGILLPDLLKVMVKACAAVSPVVTCRAGISCLISDAGPKDS